MDILAAQAHDSEYARLWLAVLDQALVDAFVFPKSSKVDRPQRRGVRLWFLTRRFEFCCEQAGLDVCWVRELIDKYQRERGRLNQHA